MRRSWSASALSMAAWVVSANSRARASLLCAHLRRVDAGAGGLEPRQAASAASRAATAATKAGWPSGRPWRESCLTTATSSVHRRRSTSGPGGVSPSSSASCPASHCSSCAAASSRPSAAAVASVRLPLAPAAAGVAVGAPLVPELPVPRGPPEEIVAAGAAPAGFPRLPTVTNPSASTAAATPVGDVGARPLVFALLALLPLSVVEDVERAAVRRASSTRAATLAPGVRLVGASPAARPPDSLAPQANWGLLPPSPTGPCCPGGRGTARAFPQSKQKRRRPKFGQKSQWLQVQSSAPGRWAAASTAPRARSPDARPADLARPPSPRAGPARPPRD